ncbi:MAG: hypothetical protein PHR57_00425 [Patescibacteria group bacterium]|nr:hypothetical protein [Patescibacteria group bacterium]
MIIGYGKSGKLISKILAEESGYDINVINRSIVNKNELWSNISHDSVFNFDDYIAPKNIGGVVVALDNNSETIDRVKVGNVYTHMAVFSLICQNQPT